MATKKMVKKPVIKKGGAKKPLKKAQDGTPVGPYQLPPEKQKEEVLYSGPFTERQTKSLNRKFPSTVTPKGSDPWYNTKTYLDSGMNIGEDPVGAEKAERADYEKFLRSSGRINFKKGGAKKMKTGGAMKKYEPGGITESESCGNPGKPRCKKTFKSKGKSKETKGSLLGTIGAGILGSLGGYAAYKKYKQQKGGATKYKTGGMVNANANLKATANAGSKGVKPGVNPKAAVSKVAKGRSGGTSAAPKTAIPKAKYGMSITKMKKK